MKQLLTLGHAAVAAIAMSLTLTTPAHARNATPTSLAWFEDHWIDLSTNWEGATACDVRTTGTVCYRTEAELDEHLATGEFVTSATSATSDVSVTSTCSSALRLYDGTSYTGLSLNFSAQLHYINLSGYGFDNKTSSYKVGACDSAFFSAASGGGLVYTGDTSAFAQATTMAFGWDNVVSSVYIA